MLWPRTRSTLHNQLEEFSRRSARVRPRLNDNNALKSPQFGLESQTANKDNLWEILAYLLLPFSGTFYRNGVSLSTLKKLNTVCICFINSSFFAELSVNPVGT